MTSKVAYSISHPQNSSRRTLKVFNIISVLKSFVDISFIYSVSTMSETQVNRYLTYRKFNQKLLIFIGLSDQFHKLAFLLPYVQLYLGLSMVFVSIRFTVNYCKTLAAVTRSLSVITGFSTIAMKMICVIIHQKEIFELQQTLDEHFLNLLKIKKVANTVLNKIDVYRLLTWSFIIFLSISSCSVVLIPAYRIIHNSIHRITPTRLLLVYPTSYPWTVPLTGNIFLLHFIFESLATVAIFTITVSVDCLFLFYTFLMVGQLREISHDISNIDEKSKIDDIVRKCVKQYSSLIKCRDNMEKIYGPIILCVIITNAIVLCTLIYQITQMKSITILRAIRILAYVLTKVIQTYMYSWCGTHLTMESEEYRNAIYGADWYGEKRFMTAIIIMLKQRPLVLSACHFSTVSVDIFMKILNTTVSYYFLIKTLEA